MSNGLAGINLLSRNLSAGDVGIALVLRDVVDEGSLEGAGKNLFLVVEECLYAFVLQFAYYAALSLLSPALCSGARQPVHLRLSQIGH